MTRPLWLDPPLISAPALQEDTSCEVVVIGLVLAFPADGAVAVVPEPPELGLEFFDMLFHFCPPRMGQISTVINVRKFLGQLEAALNHDVQQRLYRAKLGLPRGPHANAGRNFTLVHSPRKGVPVWGTLCKRVD